MIDSVARTITEQVDIEIVDLPHFYKKKCENICVCQKKVVSLCGKTL